MFENTYQPLIFEIERKQDQFFIRIANVDQFKNFRAANKRTYLSGQPFYSK